MGAMVVASSPHANSDRVNECRRGVRSELSLMDGMIMCLRCGESERSGGY